MRVYWKWSSGSKSKTYLLYEVISSSFPGGQSKFQKGQVVRRMFASAETSQPDFFHRTTLDDGEELDTGPEQRDSSLLKWTRANVASTGNTHPDKDDANNSYMQTCHKGKQGPKHLNATFPVQMTRLHEGKKSLTLLCIKENKEVSAWHWIKQITCKAARCDSGRL